MQSDERFPSDKFYKLIKHCCKQLYPDSDDGKASALISKQIAMRNKILNNKDEKDKLIKVLFLMFSKASFDLVDIVIFNALTNVQIKFSGTFEYLNSFITFEREEDEEEFFILYDSNIVFDETKDFVSRSLIGMKVPDSIEVVPVQNYTSRIRRHLISKLSLNGINPLPFFIFAESDQKKIKMKNFRCENENFISEDNSELYIVGENGELRSCATADNEDDDLKTVFITEENLRCFYDIDGINGLASEGEIHGLKHLVDLKHSKKSKKRPITRDKYVHDRGTVKNLKDLFAIHFAEVRLPGSSEERLNLFFIINSEYKLMSKSDESRIRDLVYNEILFEVRSTLMGQRLIHCHKTFVKCKPDSRSIIQAEEHSDILDSDCILTGKIDSVFIENVVKSLNEKLNSNTVTVFFEAYGTKNIFSDIQVDKIVSKLSNFIDLSILNLDIDICCNVGVNTLNNKTLCCPEGFFRNCYGIENYYLFNCSEFSTYHGHTIKRSPKAVKSSYLSLYANGISKGNIYVPFLTEYLPRHFRNIAFPCHTASLACSNLYGWTAENKSLGKFKTMIKHLKIARDGITQHLNLNIGVRAEFRISSVNIPFFAQFARSLFLHREMRYCETQKLIYLMQQGIDSLTDSLNTKKEFDIRDLALLGIKEVYFFEKFIRGGFNLHILSQSFRETFLSFKTERKINPCENFERQNLNFEESFEIVKKLFKYTTKISSESKILLNKILEYIKVDHNYSLMNGVVVRRTSNLAENQMIIEAIVEKLCKSVCSAFNVNNNLLYTGGEVSNKYNQTPISSKEIIAQYFEKPHVKVANGIYNGLYRFLINSYSEKEDIHKLIIQKMKSMNIRFFVKNICNKSLKLRKIYYNSAMSDESILEKLNIIKSSLRIGFAKSSSEDSDVKKKAPKTVLAEHFLINYGLRRDIRHSESGKQALLEDMRYPFYIYAEKYKLENSFKQYNLKKKADPEYLNDIDKFTIDSFCLEQIILYLNVCDRFIGSAEALKFIDELRYYTIGEAFIERENSFYEQLLRWQTTRPESKESYEFLLCGTNFIYKQPGKVQVVLKSKPESTSDLNNCYEFTNTVEKTSHFNKRKTVDKNSVKKKAMRSMKKRKDSTSSDGDLVILESVINPFEIDLLSVSCEKENVIEDNIDNNFSLECNSDIGTVAHDNEEVLRNIVETASSINSKPDDIDDGSLYTIDSEGNFMMLKRGEVAYKILQSKASLVSKKVFMNMCKKDLISEGIPFRDALKFMHVLEEKGIIKILCKNHKSMRVELLNKCFN